MEPTDQQPTPASAQPPPLPAWPRRPVRPVLNRALTIGCWVVVGGSAVIILFATLFTNHLDYLTNPEATLISVAEKDLDLDEAIATLPGWEQALYHALGYSRESLRGQILDGYHRVIDHLDTPDVALSARLVVLVAEIGDDEQVDDAIDLLAGTTEAERFIDAVLYAYQGVPPREGPGEDGWNLSILDTGDERIDDTAWSRDMLRVRLAEQDGRTEEAGRLGAGAIARGRESLLRGRLVEGIYLATLLAGLLVMVNRIPRRHNSVAIGDGMVVAPWSLDYGFNIIARCVAASMMAMILLSVMAEGMGWSWLYAMYTILTFAPMLFIMHHYLFRPDGSSLWHGFGMRPGSVSRKGLVLFTLALISIDQLGCLAIEMGGAWVGLPMLWEEGLDETILFGPLPLALLTLADGVIWAPLFEEIAFRGLLYVTLRTRMKPLPAAALSAGLFGMVHVYSVVGFLQVAWTGFVLAIGYEKCRCLWPCIMAHFFNNLVYFALLLLVYR